MTPPTTRPDIISAVPTSFTSDGTLDLPTLRANLERLEPLLDGVFAAGTTGEFPALADDERLEVIEQALAVFGPGRVIAHVGAASTGQAVDLAERARGLGAVRFAAVTPYYLRASVGEVRRYYAALRSACADGALYGYVFPDVALTDVAPDELPGLLEVGLDGVKVSGAASARVDAYAAATPDGFSIWSGNDADLPHLVAVGAAGTVSGVSAVVPEPWAAYRDAWAAGDLDRAAVAQQAIAELVPLLGPSIANLKHALSLRGLDSGVTRMSIERPSPETCAAIEVALERTRALVG